MIASLLLVGSIVILYWVSSMDVRLTVIGLFTGLFSLGLGLLTNGSMVEVFLPQPRRSRAGKKKSKLPSLKWH